MSVVSTNNELQDVSTKPARSVIKGGFYLFFPAGGIGKYTNELLQTMGSMPEIDMRAVCSPDYFWRDNPSYTAWTGLNKLSHPIPAIRKFRFLKCQLTNPRQCINYAKAENLDIVHFANFNHLSFPFWRNAFKKSGVKVAVSVHDVRRAKPILNKGWEDKQLVAFYQFADALFVHSEYQANELQRFARVEKSKIHVVPHGPYSHGNTSISKEEARKKYNFPLDEQVALFFGQIRDEKNLDGLINALGMSSSKPHLVVAGKAGGRSRRPMEYYMECARKAGVSDRITFLDRYISDDEVGELFEASDFTVLPYKEAFTSQSGVLNVAVHYATPVLVSTAPVLKETVETCDIGVVADGYADEHIAKGIDLLSARVEANYEHAFDIYQKKFGWEENARRTIEVYRQLISPQMQ